MKDIWEPTLTGRIDNFLERKDHEFPELGLSKRAAHYHITPQRKSFFIRQPK